MMLSMYRLKRMAAAMLCLVLAVSLVGCGSDESDITKIPEAYIDGFSKFCERGDEYKEQGLSLQADYAYGWAAASVSSMRYCVDCLLYLKGEGSSLEDVTDGRISDWDDIAEFNYASPYPWYFEGLVYNTQDKNDSAQACYEKALLNPAFSAGIDEALSVLHVMSIGELKSIKYKLTELEDKIFANWEPKTVNYPRQEMGFSDLYLRTLARECLSSEPVDYKGALRHYEAALRVNPFEGDNFVGCALTQLYLGNTEKTFFYVNEGLFVDPGHEGLLKLADVLNGGVRNGEKIILHPAFFDNDYFDVSYTS